MSGFYLSRYVQWDKCVRLMQSDYEGKFTLEKLRNLMLM